MDNVSFFDFPDSTEKKIIEGRDWSCMMPSYNRVRLLCLPGVMPGFCRQRPRARTWFFQLLGLHSVSWPGVSAEYVAGMRHKLLHHSCGHSIINL